MGFLERRTEIPIVIKHISHDEAIVISTDEVLAVLGEPREVIPSHLIRAVGATMPATDKMVEALSGRIVRLSQESMRLLRTNDIVPKDGLISGVVRNSKNGQFAGLLNFERASAVATAASALPALAAGVALQMQLARIEKKLTAIEGKLDYVIKQSHLQIEARLLAALHILDDIAADALVSGFIDDDAWSRLAEIEDDIREIQKWSSRNLAPLSKALEADSGRRGSRTPAGSGPGPLWPRRRAMTIPARAAMAINTSALRPSMASAYPPPSCRFADASQFFVKFSQRVLKLS